MTYKGFTDYSCFDSLTDQGVKFVTRLRIDGKYETLSEREPPRDSRVRSDKRIRLGVERRTMSNPLRRIEMEPRPGHDEFVLLTNHLDLDAETVAELYSERWRIEQFFRLLKQNLRVQDVCGDLGQRGADSNLDSIDRNAVAEVFDVAVAVCLVICELDSDDAAATVCLP